MRNERASRAQQFMPFAALRGYYDLVRERERVEEPRRDHTDEEVERISHVLAQLEKGTVVRCVHYEDGAYITTIGAVTEVVPELHRLRIVKDAIVFDDVYELEIVD